MLKDSTVRARVNHKLKDDAEAVLGQLGITMTEAINLFLAQIKLRQGLPFHVIIPNETTRKTMEEAEKGIGLKSYESVEALFEELDVDVNASSKNKSSIRKRSKARKKAR